MSRNLKIIFPPNCCFFEALKFEKNVENLEETYKRSKINMLALLFNKTKTKKNSVDTQPNAVEAI